MGGRSRLDPEYYLVERRERALRGIERAGLYAPKLSPESCPGDIASIIRPSRYFNAKAAALLELPRRFPVPWTRRCRERAARTQRSRLPCGVSVRKQRIPYCSTGLESNPLSSTRIPGGFWSVFRAFNTRGIP
ncbi:MAG: hypothetical protein MZU95_09040 [Desulfomicrobium escambiense]|nr:hypothetical protein [Desulfomicrobium escambiense]